ncbi:hypothetical protein D3C73_1148580 [compost metagenome]
MVRGKTVSSNVDLNAVLVRKVFKRFFKTTLSDPAPRTDVIRPNIYYEFLRNTAHKSLCIEGNKKAVAIEEKLKATVNNSFDGHWYV